jgi:crossover junction endodeoxyribonuclease RuvC
LDSQVRVRGIGIDPGLNTTGYAVVESSERNIKLVEAGVIKPSIGLPTTDIAGRLKALYDSLLGLIDQYHPTEMAVEQLYAHYEHPRTAILMGHARGVIFLAGAQRDITVRSLASTQVKKTITGSGRASKEQMQMAMLREFALPKMPEPHDVADAMAIALCQHYARKMPEATEGPKVSFKETRVKLPKFDLE